MGLSRQEHWSGLLFPSPKETIERNKLIDYTITYLHMYLPIIYLGKIVLGENGGREKEGRRVGTRKGGAERRKEGGKGRRQ